MMIWCAYCQHFLKESAPFDKLDISHGMCDSCAKKGLSLTQADEAKLKQLVELQRELYAAGKAGDRTRIKSLIQSCNEIGVRPMDMIFGFLSPMLVRIGKLWELGEVSVIEEHRFTHFCEQLLDSIKATSTISNEQPHFILASADGNYHNFGLKLIQLWLESRGYQVELITPSLPMDELLKYTMEIKPQYIGLSISLEEQIAAVKSYTQSLASSPNSSVKQVFIGGHAVKAGIVKPSDLAPALLIKDPEELSIYLKSA